MCYDILIIFLDGPIGTKLKILIDHFIPKISVQKRTAEENGGNTR